MRHVQDLLTDDKTLDEKRLGELFKRPVIPFGSIVEYYLISAKDHSNLNQFGKTMIFGIFFGYALSSKRM